MKKWFAEVFNSKSKSNFRWFFPQKIESEIHDGRLVFWRHISLGNMVSFIFRSYSWKIKEERREDTRKTNYNRQQLNIQSKNQELIKEVIDFRGKGDRNNLVSNVWQRKNTDRRLTGTKRKTILHFLFRYFEIDFFLLSFDSTRNEQIDDQYTIFKQDTYWTCDYGCRILIRSNNTG